MILITIFMITMMISMLIVIRVRMMIKLMVMIHLMLIVIVLLICELLVNGRPSSAVPADIQSSCAAFTGVEAKELPSVSFVRQCRTVLQNINETLSAFRLGQAETWHQVFTDGTARRQIAIQNLVVALMEGNDLDPVIVFSSMQSLHTVRRGGLGHWR